MMPRRASGNPLTPAGRFGTLRNSLTFRLVARFILVATAIALLVCAVYVLTEIRKDRRNAETMARLTAIGLAESARLPLFSGNREELSKLARFAVGNPEIHRATVLDESGRVLADAGRPGASSLRPLSVEVRQNSPASSPESVLTGEGGHIAHPIGTVRLEYETIRLAEQIRGAVLFGGAFAVLFLALVSVLSYPVLRRAMRSFDDLIAGIGAIREGDYDRVLAIDSGSELGIAAANVNDLAASLKRQHEENRELHRSLESEIRERSQAEAESREGERTLRDLMDAMPAGVTWADPDGNIQFMNRYTIDCFGYGYDELRTVEDWFSRAYPDPAYRQRILEARSAAAEAAKARGIEASSYEGMVACRDGGTRHVLFCNLSRKGRMVTTLLDITEREAMQDRVNRAQKMETLGILAGGIAHNFNNALTSVLGYVSYAQRKLDNPAKAFDLLKKAEDASHIAAGIAGQLLTFARGGEPIKAPLSVPKVVADAVSLSLVGTSVVASIELPPALDDVEADEGQIAQVLNNLLVNAVQAMPGGGTIVIRGENVAGDQPPPEGLPPGSYVRIAIKDQGCGITDDLREKIFDPYFTTRAGIGNGLGLASVRSIVEKHGGTVTVRSEVGHGATFTLTLPSSGTRAPETSNRPDGPAPAHGSGDEILFLDDEASIRNLARETLEHFGYRVTTCRHGEDAIDLYREAKAQGKPFAAAVLDLTIPAGPGGREVAERILAIDPAALLVVSSGYSSDPVMADHRNYGFRAAVPKPYKDDELTLTLSSLLAEGSGRRRSLQPASGSR
jgi:signal transduction histidine kinase/CheY-like chemotaxis protein